MTGSYDPSLALIYWGTGNPCPDFIGDERKGDNLYTASVIALDVKTGKLKWHYQFTPHDIHDWDSSQPMVLVDETWEGQPRKLLLHTDKNGMLYVLDRTNGKFLRGTPFTSLLTWNSGFDKNGRPILTQIDIVCPSSGVNWTDVAYSPQTKLFYGRVTDSCGVNPQGESGLDPLAGNNRWFGAVGARTPSTPEMAQRLAEIRAKYPPGPFVRAVNLATGRKVWDYELSMGRTTGVLATAGNLVFIGGMGGIVALNAMTGEKLWHVDAGQTKCDGVCNAASAMTYMVGGKQYLAMSGYGTLIGYGLEQEGRTVTSLGASPVSSTTKPGAGEALPTAPGKDVTLRVCSNCHAADVWSGLRLRQSAWEETLERMRVRGMALAPDEYKTVLDYLSKYWSGVN